MVAKQDFGKEKNIVNGQLRRSSHVPTPKLRSWVKKRILLGTPINDVAKGIGICPNTLKKLYEEELKFVDEANANVKGKLYQLAMEGNVQAVIFWCKTKLGMRENFRIEHEHAVQYVDKPKDIELEEWTEYWKDQQAIAALVVEAEHPSMTEETED